MVSFLRFLVFSALPSTSYFPPSVLMLLLPLLLISLLLLFLPVPLLLAVLPARLLLLRAVGCWRVRQHQHVTPLLLYSTFRCGLLSGLSGMPCPEGRLQF